MAIIGSPASPLWYARTHARTHSPPPYGRGGDIIFSSSWAVRLCCSKSNCTNNRVPPTHEADPKRVPHTKTGPEAAREVRALGGSRKGGSVGGWFRLAPAGVANTLQWFRVFGHALKRQELQGCAWVALSLRDGVKISAASLRNVWQG